MSFYLRGLLQATFVPCQGLVGIIEDAISQGQVYHSNAAASSVLV